jgi:hypothetical protein
MGGQVVASKFSGCVCGGEWGARYALGFSRREITTSIVSKSDVPQVAARLSASTSQERIKKSAHREMATEKTALPLS